MPKFSAEEVKPNWIKPPITEEPPPNARQRRPGRKTRGKWYFYLLWCYERPGKWHRTSWPVSDALHRRSLVQMASDIRHKRLLANQPGAEEEGEWLAYYGVAKDENDLDQFYIWAQWVPANTKPARKRKVVT